MNKRLGSLAGKFLNPTTLLVLLVLVTVAVSLQHYFLPEREFFGAIRPRYNNYLIFKYSFAHLVSNLNLYILHPAEYGDYFKYSPTFAFSMGLFYYLPDWLGMIFWNLANTLFLFIGIKLLPQMDDKRKALVLLLVLSELTGSLQNQQSNALVTGLILLTFVSFEKKQVMMAALFIVMAMYIKLFGVLAAAMFLLYPRKVKFILYMLMWTLIFWALPLLVISPAELVDQYANWLILLKADYGLSHGFSVMGVLHQWFGLNPSKWLLILAGVVLFATAYIRRDLFSHLTYRYLMLSSILIWMVIFNHKAESPTYIIAMTGCALWFFTQKPTPFNTVLIVLALVFISLAFTDLSPAGLRVLLYQYYVKAIPAILIWCVIVYQMVSGNFKPLKLSD